MSETSEPTTARSTLADELRAIKVALDQHNRTIRRSRRFGWALAGAFVLVTGLGVAVYVDDQNDDRRECETDNANSVRDSEVLIGAVEQSNPSPETREAINRYREEVRRNLREC